MKPDTSVVSFANQKIRLQSTSSLLSVSLMLVALLAAGCSKNGANGSISTPFFAGPKQHDLAIVGYNYTDREIGTFSVDGVGGGNLALSGATSGGGGIACCVRYVPGSEPSKYLIRWDKASCRFNERPPGPWGEIFHLHYYYAERSVQVKRGNDSEANYFEVHFFPDGSIDARITAELSPPLMELPDGRKSNNSPQCPGNVRPAGVF